MIYKNNSITTKTFYGITFKPGDIKFVPGYINNKGFIQIKSVPKELPKSTEEIETVVSKKRGRPKKTKSNNTSVSNKADNSKPKHAKSLEEDQSNEGGKN